jgi:hypothetical protein
MTAGSAGTAPGGAGGGGAFGNGAAGSTGRLTIGYTTLSNAVSSNIIRFLMSCPLTEMPNLSVIARAFTAGRVGNVDVFYTTGGHLTMTAWSGGTQLWTTGPQAWGVNGIPVLVEVNLSQSGTDIAWWFTSVDRFGNKQGVNGTFAGPAAIGQVRSVIINPDKLIDDTAVGHVSVQYEYSEFDDMLAPITGYWGEQAADRFLRLCGEENVPATVVGNNYDTQKMGPQLPGKNLVALLTECRDADQGLMFEPRDSFGLAYRTRASLCNQQPAVVLNYAGGDLAVPLQPVDDDQHLHNDITVTRNLGSSAHASLDEGPMSTADPPGGTGRYTQSATVNVDTDELLPDVAGWMLNLGTQDELRFPVINVDLSRAEAAYVFGLIQQVGHGDMVQVTSPPSFLPPQPINQLALGFTEILSPLGPYPVSWNCVPEKPYETAVIEDSVLCRADTDGAMLAADCTSGAVTISVGLTSDIAQPWTTDPDDLPFDILAGGEQMTVTAVSGAAVPQTLTVIRSVNGIVKAHTAGDDVRLAYPAVIAMGFEVEFAS